MSAAGGSHPSGRILGLLASVAAFAVLAAWFGRRRARRAELRREQRRRALRPVAPGDVRLSVVVPAYREAERIGHTVRRLRAALAPVTEHGGLEIVVVDDGSDDGTAGEARSGGADVVLIHERNRGKGASVRDGVLAARGRTIAFTDADLSYPPEQIARLLQRVEEGWDVVVGSRRHDDTTTVVRAGPLRELSSRVFNLLTASVLLGRYADTQCGIKAFRSDVARALFSRARLDGFAFDVELFSLVERYHLSLTEEPVTVANTRRSTVRVVQDAARMVRDLFRVRRWSLEGAYDDDLHGAVARLAPRGQPVGCG